MVAGDGPKPGEPRPLRATPEELAHYAKATVDILYRFPHGLEELEGIANRTDFDLGSHTKDQEALGITARVLRNEHSTQRLAYRDPETGKWFVPYVIEPSAGVDRGSWPSSPRPSPGRSFRTGKSASSSSSSPSSPPSRWR